MHSEMILIVQTFFAHSANNKDSQTKFIEVFYGSFHNEKSYINFIFQVIFIFFLSKQLLLLVSENIQFYILEKSKNKGIH